MRTTSTALAAAALGAAVLATAGCSSNDSKSGTTDQIKVSVAHGQVSPKPSVRKVHLGDRVKISVTSDRADEVHLHGYDKEIEIKPNTPGTIDFTANVPGVFEVETHKTNLQLFQLSVK